MDSLYEEICNRNNYDTNASLEAISDMYDNKVNFPISMYQLRKDKGKDATNSTTLLYANQGRLGKINKAITNLVSIKNNTAIIHLDEDVIDDMLWEFDIDMSFLMSIILEPLFHSSMITNIKFDIFLPEGNLYILVNCIIPIINLCDQYRGTKHIIGELFADNSFASLLPLIICDELIFNEYVELNIDVDYVYISKFPDTVIFLDMLFDRLLEANMITEEEINTIKTENTIIELTPDEVYNRFNKK